MLAGPQRWRNRYGPTSCRCPPPQRIAQLPTRAFVRELYRDTSRQVGHRELRGEDAASRRLIQRLIVENRAARADDDRD